MSKAAIMATIYKPIQIQLMMVALLRYAARMCERDFSRFSSLFSTRSEDGMRSPRNSSSHDTSKSSAIAGSMEISGQDVPVSQLEIVLLETPR